MYQTNASFPMSMPHCEILISFSLAKDLCPLLGIGKDLVEIRLDDLMLFDGVREFCCCVDREEAARMCHV